MNWKFWQREVIVEKVVEKYIFPPDYVRSEQQMRNQVYEEERKLAREELEKYRTRQLMTLRQMDEQFKIAQEALHEARCIVRFGPDRHSP